ncbi:MAG: archease [Candidatus Woesearchaeota archaeon]|jgi:SHS2 domain-containing protein|nr:archease [Candidatus Woesearchaeota archaeon]MDP7323299.1 archease [Candidatus Woesearchaeota archaeon]MDP7457662.1 archease [Candidatus Woesearchaeota archaeon]
MKYEFLDHTADAQFRAYGKDLEEAFSHAAEAMYAVMLKPDSIEKNVRKKVEAKGEDSKSLLYDFLEQLLVLLNEGFLLNSVEKISIDNNKALKATVVGDNIKEKYDVHSEVKAITYHEMEIKKVKGKVMVQVIVDI